MKKYKVVHIINNDKFIKPFIDFIEKNFNSTEHLFIFISGGDEKVFFIPKANNIININNLYIGKKNILKLSNTLTPYFKQADKVILHSLFSDDLINYLYLHQKFLKKSFWVMWGGDLYAHILTKQTIKNTFFRYRKKRVIKLMGGLVTYIKGDFELAKKWYGATGQHYECFMYPSNIYKEYSLKEKINKTINIQVGNSADSTNNHIKIFEKLKKYKNENINIYVPLSYGNKEYARKVTIKGKKLFKDKFHPMTEFMEFDKYLDFLGHIDIAIFAHKRQQAMGNIITLLGLGKKVYMRNDITPWNLFKDINVKVYDISNIKLNILSNKEKKLNQVKIQEYFSEENYLKQLKILFKSN